MYKYLSPMELATLQLLKYGASTETVSVEHYPDGSKCYAFPVLSMLFDDEYVTIPSPVFVSVFLNVESPTFLFISFIA